MQETTLCYIETHGKYLMMLRNRKPHDPNRDKWIGVGGKLEKGESAELCAIREIREETGLNVLDLTPRGIVHFNSDVWENELMYLFTVTKFEGDITDCDEGELRWIDKSEIFNLNLWDGDRIFLKYLIDDAPPFDMTLNYSGERLRECIVDGRELELLDIYKEDGTPAGYVAERSFAHQNALWHATAHIWVIRSNGRGGHEVLLQLRSARKKLHPAKYDVSCAGHIDAGEDILVGAVRELKEELGISVIPQDLKFITTMKSVEDLETDGEWYHDREHCNIFIYRSDVLREDMKLQESEVDGVIWVDLDECARSVSNESNDEFPNCINPVELGIISQLIR